MRHNTLPIMDRPVERVYRASSYCTIEELLAVIIGGARPLETAAEVLAAFRGDLAAIAKSDPEALNQVSGVGNSTAARIRAAVELGVRVASRQTGEKVCIHSPVDVFSLLGYEMKNLDTEQLRVILLDTRNNVVDAVLLYSGSVNSSQVRIAEIFKPAIARMAPSIILVHNHPSGDPTPSSDDVAVTRAVVQAGKLLDIQVLDHIVLGGDRHVSLKERGLGFS